MLGEHVSLSSSLGAALCGTERRLDTRFVTAREADRSDPPKPSEHGIGSGQETAPRRLFRRRRRRARSPARAGVTTESSDVLLATSGSLVRAEPTPAFVFARVFAADGAAWLPTSRQGSLRNVVGIEIVTASVRERNFAFPDPVLPLRQQQERWPAAVLHCRALQHSAGGAGPSRLASSPASH